MLGLLGVVLGAQALVYGAVGIADELGLSGGFVGVGAMVVTALVVLVFMTTKRLLSRGEAALLIGCYVVLLPLLR